MKIYSTFTPINNKYSQSPSRATYPNLAPLCADTVSFTAMKKREFEGFDLAVVEKFKAPIGNFHGQEDFNNWASEKALAISEKDYGGRQEESQIQRKTMLKEWSNYVLKENDAYTPAMKLVILNAITKDLKPNEDKIPPTLNKGVLADCVAELNKRLSENPKQNFDFHKMYETKLRALYLEDTNTGESGTKWVVIPSKKHDPENFEANVDKLKTLSHKNWCTKSFNAEPYLKDGDFHVYIEDGQPKIGVRFVGNKIQEIQGELNNNKIPLSYFDNVDNYIKDNGFELSYNAEEEIEEAQELKIKVEKIKKDLACAIKNNDVEEIFDYFEIDYEKDNDGNLILDDYLPLEDSYTFTDIGIDENKLFEKIVEIKSFANFSKSKVTNLGSLKSIGGQANFSYSQITNLGNLQSIGRDAYFEHSQITSLDNLKAIGGDAYFEHSQITNLGNLQSIAENAHFEHSSITNLGNLKAIGRTAFFQNCHVKDLGKLKFVGLNVYIYNSPLKHEDFDHIKIQGQIID